MISGCRARSIVSPWNCVRHDEGTIVVTMQVMSDEPIIGLPYNRPVLAVHPVLVWFAASAYAHPECLGFHYVHAPKAYVCGAFDGRGLQ